MLNTELVETLNRIMRSAVVKDCVEEEEVDLKKTAIDILQGLLEGQGKKLTIYERIISVIHLDTIVIASRPPVNIDGTPKEDNPSEEVIVLRSECEVFLQMLYDYRPSLQDDVLALTQTATGEAAPKANSSHTASIEVVWRGELQRRFFHIPNICKHLSKATRSLVVESVDRTNTENKLLDFLSWSRKLYNEIKHQEELKEMRLSFIFNQQGHSNTTWLQFIVCFVINLLLIGYYSVSQGTYSLPSRVQSAVDVLNLFLLALSAFTLIMSIVLKGPLAYKQHEDAGNSKFMCLLLAATESTIVYYIIYLVFAVLGCFYDYVFTAFLLLDLVKKNATTRNVLNAVVYPRRQIGFTLMLVTFICYIFSFIYVSILLSFCLD